MPFSDKHKKYILQQKNKLSTEEIARELNVDRTLIEEFLKSSKKSTPRWFYLVMFLLPVLIILLLETSLRILITEEITSNGLPLVMADLL